LGRALAPADEPACKPGSVLASSWPASKVCMIA